MDLPTYTNIWRIEKRLYKLYDLRLPMPLPIVWIGVFVGVFVPWSLLLVLVGVPVEMPWHVLYLVPPGIVTWLSTRPVIEGKRLTELLESQLRYLGQPKAWYRLAPMSEPETVTFSARVWRTTPARAKSKAPRKARQPQRRREGQRIAGPRQVRPAVAAAAAAASQAPVAEPTTGRWGTRRGTAPALKARVRETAPPSAPRGGVGALRREEALPGGPGRRQDALPPGNHDSSELPTRESVDARDVAAWDRGDARDVAAWDRGDAREAAAWDRGDAREAAARERTGRGEAAAALADVGAQEPAAETRGREAAAEVRGQEAAGRDGDVQRFGSGSPDDTRADRETAGAVGSVRETETHRPAAGKPIDTEALRRLRRLAASADAPAASSVPSEGERRDQDREEERLGELRGERREDLDGERPEERRGQLGGGRREDEVARDQHRKGQPPRLGPSLVLSGTQRVWPPLNPDAKPLPRPAATRPATESLDTTPTAPPQQDTAPSTTVGVPDASGDLPGAVGDAQDVGLSQPVAEVTDARGGMNAPGATDDGPKGDASETVDDGPKSDTSETAGDGSKSDTSETAGDGPKSETPETVGDKPKNDAPKTAGDGRKSDAPETAGAAAVGDAPEMRDGGDAPGAAPEGDTPQSAAEVAEVPGSADAQEPGAADERERPTVERPGQSAAERPERPTAERPGQSTAERPERSAAEPPERSTVRRLVAKGDAPGAAVPGTRGDRGPAAPGTRGDRSGSLPGTRGDRGAGVPDARDPAAGDRRVAAASAGDSRGAASVGEGQSVAGAGDGRGAAANAGDSRGAAARERGGEFVAPVPVPRPGEGRVRRVESVVGRDSGGWRRIAQVVVGGGGVRTDGSEIDEARARGVFGGSRRIVVLGCTGGAGQSTTALMLGHTFAHYRDDRVVAVDANTGGGTLTSKIQPETPETLTSLLSGLDRVSGYLTMRGYTTRTASGLEVISADSDAGAEQRLADRSFFSDHRLGESMRLLDRHYKLAVIDPAAALAARLLPYADQLVLVVPASEEASEAVAMTYEWLDGHGCAELRRRAVMVVNGVSRRSMADVEQAESVARGRCRAIVRVPWEDGLAPEGAEVVDPGQLRAAGKRAYLALAGVVIAGFAAQAQTVRPSEEELASDPPGTRIGER
ncbi:TcpE family conjugal transfer membrane protein [Nonomuraea jabiensis]|uniref:MinD-like ATPase involved in chromosome partitioning or flagellar assembly n=1 Tax=Nonomuraea jabiensis TaxID=882448 RepID=A0A7W9G046_9ACTN|nr:TcpE family conjugal transfer membrane protein [Nonomuraea jabiensis]MBB5774721.1 MinD-like ATPase involved in chromosome partitioning or flagellar assembly [Nonomuraea jabiensis]